MILFINDQSKLRDKLASLAIKDIVADSELLKWSMLNENSHPELFSSC
ncbi:MAG: hypothetical protein CM1200mP28_12070 [Deltaproteobacteria bacterium]|nr:MAG: hypothetical protein CM1200mP28_12070 [Deltaproteobacteria bacterium]